MKITANQAELCAALSKLKGVVPTKPAVQSLSFVKAIASADGKGVSFLGTNIDLSISAKMACEVDAGGDKAVLLPFATLHSIVQAAPGGELTLECKDGGKASIKTATGHFRLSTLPSDTFPPVKRDADETKVALSCADLLEMLSKTRFAQARPSEARDNLRSALVEMAKEEVSCVTVNGRALARVVKGGCAGADEAISVVVPQNTVLEMLRTAPTTGDAQVVVPKSGTYAIFAFDRVTYKSKLVEGKFPDWRQVLPAGDSDEIVVTSASLVNAIRRTSILLSGTDLQYIHLKVGADTITVSSPSTDIGEATERVRCENPSGKEFELAFDHALLSDALSSPDAEKVTLSYYGGHHPLVITDGGSYYSLVMPMRVQ